MNHLQFQPEFIERTLSALLMELLPLALIVPTSETTPVDIIESTGKAKKGDKPKRKYIPRVPKEAWTDFQKTHRLKSLHKSSLRSRAKEGGWRGWKEAGCFVEGGQGEPQEWLKHPTFRGGCQSSQHPKGS